MGLLGILKAIFGGQTNLQAGKQNQSAQTGDNSPVSQTQTGDVSGNVTINNSQSAETDNE